MRKINKKKAIKLKLYIPKNALLSQNHKKM